MKISNVNYQNLRHRLPMACAFASALLFSACSDDRMERPVLSSEVLRFEVAESNGWQQAPESRAAQNGVFMLQGENPADSLFLHATISDDRVWHIAPEAAAQTRATPVDGATFYDSFGVLASVYEGSWNENSCLPNYMYNVEVTKASAWTTSYRWPGSSRNVRFFAYAPYNSPGISLSSVTTAGTPSIAYAVPSDVADQKDLLVASSAEMAGDAAKAATLTFGHALTAVRFTAGNMLSGTITGITIKGVYGSASLPIGATAWNGYGSETDFSQTFSPGLTVTSGEAITPAEATFMMLPQTLPAGASIEIAYADDATGTARTLSADIGGAVWPMGKTVTYSISTTSFITSTFSVTMPTVTYKGGNAEYSVSSYAAVSGAGGTVRNVPVAWTAEFVEDDGNGGYNVVPRPEWVKAFTESGEGATTAVKYTAEIAAQQGDAIDHEALLQAALPVSGIYDLSTNGGMTAMNTANCYLVNAPGTYSLPLVYGNAIKNGATNASAYTSSVTGTYVLKNFVNHLGAAITDPYIYNNANCTPANATLVWQDEQNLVTNVALSADNQHLTFEVPQESIKQGNAIVAVRDASNRIMWSWHIWVTDYRLGEDIRTVTNYQGVQYRFMPINLGWCHETTSMTYPSRSVRVRFTQPETGVAQVVTLTQLEETIFGGGNSPYYQFGRKDPMLPAKSGNVDKSCYSDGYAFNKSGTGKVAIYTTIRNPHVSYSSGNTAPGEDWCSVTYNNLWSADNAGTSANDNAVVKTVYDPSPVGFCLPAPNAFMGFTYNGANLSGNYYGSLFNSPYASAADFTANYGWVFYCAPMSGSGQYDLSGGTIHFPALGYRYNSPASAKFFGTMGFFWAATPITKTSARNINFSSSYINPVSVDGCERSLGFAVRPVQE